MTTSSATDFLHQMAATLGFEPEEQRRDQDWIVWQFRYGHLHPYTVYTAVEGSDMIIALEGIARLQSEPAHVVLAGLVCNELNVVVRGAKLTYGYAGPFDGLSITVQVDSVGLTQPDFVRSLELCADVREHVRERLGSLANGLR